MVTINYPNLVSAVSGVVGTIILFKNSYAVQPLEGGIFGSDAITSYNENIKKKNERRVVNQRVGLAFVCISFAIQICTSISV